MTVSHARTFLFVPGDRPDRFAAAAASGAGEVVLDLEDAVAPERKDLARRAVADWLAGGGRGLVRVNTGELLEQDLDVTRPAAVMLPKVESADDVHRVVRQLPRSQVVALVETAAGVVGIDEVCGADGLARVAFGNVDLASTIGVDPGDHEALLHARSRIVLASAAAGLPGPVDGVTLAIRDVEAVATDAARGRRLGFTGKLCIHPAQVEPVDAAMRPSADELSWAHAVVAADDGGVAVLDGRMIDAPVVARARRLIDGAAPVTTGGGRHG